MKAKAYLAFVRPTVEYASVIWFPYATCDITALEVVQHKAARFVCNDFLSYSSMTAMINNLKWNSLEDRKKQARLTYYSRNSTIKHLLIRIHSYITIIRSASHYT